MIYTYEDYQTMGKSLTFAEMAILHKKMVFEIGTDKEALVFYQELYEAAVKYMESRSNWLRFSREEKMENDKIRTSRHDMFIVKLNQLYRYLLMTGRKAVWRKELGEEQDPESRKRIGDFACYLVFIESLNAR